READSYHYNIDYAGARLDSYAGRLTVQPSSSMNVSAWGAYMYDHDRLEPNVGVQMYGASVQHTIPVGTTNGSVSSALIWGLMIHHHGPHEHNHDPNTTVKSYHLMSSVLAESEVRMSDRWAVYGRAEQVQKSADQLGFLGGDSMQLFTIRALSFGA